MFQLKFLQRTHFEDIVEERALMKTCGYVLCDKPLTVITKHKYHICTKTNKVFDITKRKNFCSATCYTASDYILEQMLTSPLWLRDIEEHQEYKILPDERSFETHGEVMVAGQKIQRDVDEEGKKGNFYIFK